MSNSRKSHWWNPLLHRSKKMWKSSIFIIFIGVTVWTGQARADCLDIPHETISLSQSELDARKAFFMEWCGGEQAALLDASDETIRRGVKLPGGILRHIGNDDDYPDSGGRLAHEGTAVVAVLMDINGDILKVMLVRSSGHKELDLEAVQFYMHMHEDNVATLNGRPIRAILYRTVTFRRL